MTSVIFDNLITIFENTSLSLGANTILNNDINLLSGKTLTISAFNLITISTSSGTITIGGSGSSSKISIKESDKSNYFKETPEEDNTNVFILSQNFPNPFNPFSVINYSIPNDAKVIIKIYDILGREITTLVNEFKTAGKHTTQFDGSNLTSGVYFYSLTAGDNRQVKKMILAK